MEKIKFGSLLPSLRAVPKNKLTNKGKSLTEAESKDIFDNYNVLISKVAAKKDAIAVLSSKYARGYWSILNIVDKNKISDAPPYFFEGLN
jgi:hypothetical protein